MPVTPYQMDAALNNLTNSSICAAYQDPARLSAQVTSNGTDTLTISPATAFSIVPGKTVLITSTNLPTVLVGRDLLYIGPTNPAVTGQFHCYANEADAVAALNKLTGLTGFTGTVIDADLERQTSLAAMTSYESSFTGYLRKTHSYSAGSEPTDQQLVRTGQITLSNTGTSTALVSHIFVLDGNPVAVAAVARLASVASIPAAQSLTVTTQMTVTSA